MEYYLRVTDGNDNHEMEYITTANTPVEAAFHIGSSYTRNRGINKDNVKLLELMTKSEWKEREDLRFK